MMLRDLALQGIENTINALLNLDEQALLAMQKLHGQCIAIRLNGIGLMFHFVPDQQGCIQLFSQWEGAPDCIISGSPFDLMRASDKSQDSAQLFAGNVTIEGNTELGHKFSAVLADLHIDWEEQLSRFVGDTVAHEVGRRARDAQAYKQQRTNTFKQNLAEYLTEEARLSPHPYAMQAWSRDVATARDDVERLMARVDLLDKQSNA